MQKLVRKKEDTVIVYYGWMGRIELHVTGIDIPTDIEILTKRECLQKNRKYFGRSLRI